MTSITFDSLAYFDELKNAGFEEKQARVMAEGMRRQNEAFREIAEEMDEKKAQELATKGDIAAVRNEIATLRADMTNEFKLVRAEMREINASTRYSLLIWQIGIGMALVAIMAKGFGWVGF